MDDSVAMYTQAAAAEPANARARWLLLIHQIPPKPDYFRVKVRRRLARLGAAAMKSTVYVLPHGPATLEDFQWLRREIVDGGGEAIVCEAKLVEGMSDAELEALFLRDRDTDYAEIAEDAAAALHDIHRIDPDSERRTELETLIARLRRRLHDVVALDFFGAPNRSSAEKAINALIDRLGVRAATSDKSSHDRERLTSRVWVTRREVFVDRIASAWLIRTFIDPDARFKFVSGTKYHPASGEVRFDMFEAEYTHEGDRCTFEVLLERFGLERDPALLAIAEIVHDIDLKDSKFARAEAAGIEQVLSGIVRSVMTDEARVEAGGVLFASLHDSFREPSPDQNAMGSSSRRLRDL
jgi:hypothetical protein